MIDDLSDTDESDSDPVPSPSTVPAHEACDPSPRSRSFLPQVDPVKTEDVIASQDGALPTPIPRELTRTLGIWYYMSAIWAPPIWRPRIMDEAHFNAPAWHPRTQKMTTIIQRLYKWRGLYDDIRTYLRSCLQCQRTRPGGGARPATQYFHPVEGPFQTIYMDIWGPFTWRKQASIALVIIDHHTKAVEIAILPNKTSEAIASAFFSRWISQYGAPQVIMTDNDRVFIYDAMQRITELFNIKAWRATIYHPQGNAVVESFHRSLSAQLMGLRMVAEDVLTLEEAIAFILMSYRALPHSTAFDSPGYLTHSVDISLGHQHSLNTGFRPEEAVTKRLLVLNEVRAARLQRAQLIHDNQRKNQRPEEECTKLTINDIILVKLTPRQLRSISKKLGSTKLASPWSLPMRVVETNRRGTRGRVRCGTTGWQLRVHLDRCRALLLPPPGSILEQQWQRICQNELGLFQQFLPASPPSLSATPVSRKRVRLNP
jgi:transposase InsO family protein